MEVGKYIRTKEIKEKNRKGNLGKKHSEETKKKIGLGNLGKECSKETKEKLSLLKLGNTVWVGRKHKENSKLKQSLAHQGIKNPMYGKKGTRLGVKVSEKTKIKISKAHKIRYANNPELAEAIKKRRATQILPKKDTTIEVKIQNFLKQLEIEFFTHQYMKIEHGYQCDILIPSMNLVIECDGDYWHKYPIGNDLDHIRTKELLKKGFKVLRLWEYEIRKLSINSFRNRLLEV